MTTGIIAAVVYIAIWLNNAATASNSASIGNNERLQSSQSITNTSNNANFTPAQTVSYTSGATADMRGESQQYSGGVSVIVDAKGIVTCKTSIPRNSQLFMTNANGTQQELKLNDKEMDSQQLNSIEEGQKLVHTLTIDNVNYIMYDAFITKWPGYLTSLLPTELVQIVWGTTASCGFILDFGSSCLAPQLVDAASKDPMYRYASGMTEEPYYQWDDMGGFIVFEGVNKAYNVPDAGNFLWGHAMARLGTSSQLMWAGSNGNELLNKQEADRKADQTAIFDGARYAGAITDPLHNLIGDKRVRPTWFQKTGDIYGRKR
jgi:hypothetical protein